MSYRNDFIISKGLPDNLSHKTYDGGGHVALVRHTVGIVHGIFEEYMSYALFVYTLEGIQCTDAPHCLKNLFILLLIWS